MNPAKPRQEILHLEKPGEYSGACWVETDQHRLILAIAQHVIVGIVGDRVDMGRHFRFAFVRVTLDNVRIVHRQPFIRVNGDAEQAGVGVDEEVLIPLLEIVDDSSLGQVRHVGHVLE